MPDSPDFALLHPDGRIEYGHRDADQSAYGALKARIEHVSTQGMGQLRAWFTDDFSSLPRNPLADRVWTSVGYHHPTGWRGTVGVTMEEDSSGDCPPLSAAVRATLEELADG